MTARWGMREFVQPLPLAAVAVLAVNDLWLKGAFHNALTGKLSDLAGCFFFPLYLSALLGLVAPQVPLRARLLLGCFSTTALFAALELSPAAIGSFCQVSGRVARWLFIDRPCRLTADPTDLLALALVPLAYLYGARTIGAGEPAPAAPSFGH